MLDVAHVGLDCLSVCRVCLAGSEEAGQAIQGQGLLERVHNLVATTDTPAAAAGGGTAALLHNTSLLDYAGFAMTAKPSVNLLVLLQVSLAILMNTPMCSYSNIQLAIHHSLYSTGSTFNMSTYTSTVELFSKLVFSGQHDGHIGPSKMLHCFFGLGCLLLRSACPHNSLP